MALFHYEAINAAGRVVAGTHEGELVQDVEAWLDKGGLSPISIRVLSDRAGSPAAAGEEPARPGLRERLFGVTLDDKILFSRQLSTLLAAGVSILQALSVLALQASNPLLREIILAISAEVESGASLSDAVRQHPRAFNQLFLNMVRVGEETGSLDRAFAYLATLYENEKLIKERIKSATRYPKLVITALVGAAFFLMTFVVPRFATLFAKSGVELPLPTRILMATSSFLADNTLGIAALAVICFVAYRLAMGSRDLVLLRDSLLLRVPIFGPLAVKIYMARFCRVFSVLTVSGIDIIKTLQLSATALENLVLFDMMGLVAADVTAGISIHEAMGKHDRFPPLVIQMVSVGEQSGQLDKMMDQVADYYDTESEYTIKNLSTLIEPVLLVVMGLMVGFMALAIFTPMWNMMSVVRGG